MSMSMWMPEHEHEPMPEYEPLPKKPRLEIQSLTKEELAHLQATEEGALKEIIWDICSSSLELCKQLSDQLYRSLLDGVAVLAYLLFDKEELYELGHSRMLYDQQNKFWEQLEGFAQKGDSFYEVCKWIANTNINWDGYSLLNECNVAAMLKSYNSDLCNSCPYRKPFVDYIARGLEIKKCPIDDDIEEAIKKAKQYQRLTVDEYTFLLLEIFRDVLSEKCQEFLLAKAVECIDVKALYSLEADAIQDLVELSMHSSAHEELDWLIKSDLLELIRVKKKMVKDRLRTSTIPFSILLHNEFELREIVELRYTVPPPLTIFDLISIAELRRKAEGSRFINRDHFLWAFDERGCGLRTALKGLRTALKEELASRVGAEDHPPYFIYDIVLRLARAEYVNPSVIYLAFAVVFGKFGFCTEEVKELQEYFNHFKTAICDMMEPKNLMSSNDWYFGDDSIKVFKERLDANNGIWWYPFTA